MMNLKATNMKMFVTVIEINLQFFLFENIPNQYFLNLFLIPQKKIKLNFIWLHSCGCLNPVRQFQVLSSTVQLGELAMPCFLRLYMPVSYWSSHTGINSEPQQNISFKKGYRSILKFKTQLALSNFTCFKCLILL